MWVNCIVGHPTPKHAHQWLRLLLADFKSFIKQTEPNMLPCCFCHHQYLSYGKLAPSLMATIVPLLQSSTVNRTLIGHRTTAQPVCRH